MSKTALATKPVAANAAGIVPTEYKVLVKPVQELGYIPLKGGMKIYKPDETKDRDQHAAMEGELIAVSPFAFQYEEWPAGMKPPGVGQTVIFARYSGVTVKGADGAEYRLMNDKDVVGVRA